MSTNEKFDEDIRKKLNSYQENPPAGLWQQIEKKSVGDGGFNFLFRLNGLLFTDLLLLISLGLIINVADLKSPDLQQNISNHHATKTEVSQSKEQPAITPASNQPENIGVSAESNNPKITASLHSTYAKHNETTEKQITRNFYVQPVLHLSSPVSINSEDIQQLPDAINPKEKEEVEVNLLPVNEALLKAIEQQTIEYFQYLEQHPQKEITYEQGYNEPVDIELMVSPLLNLNVFESAQSNLTIKRETGKFSHNNSFSIRIRGSITPHLYFKTGFMFTQTEDQLFIHREEEKTIEQIDSIQGFIHFPFEPPIPHTVYDTSIVQQHFIYDFQSSLRIQRIDIPMLIGYQFNAGKLRMELSAGILFNLSLSGNGTLPGEQFNEEIVVMKGENNTLRKQSAASIYTGFGIAYPSGKQTEIFAEPFYIQSTNTVTVKDATVKARMNYAGLNMGFRIRFEKK